MAADAHLGRSIRSAVPADAGLGRGYLDECHCVCSHIDGSCSGTRTGVRFEWHAYRTDVRFVKPRRRPRWTARPGARRSRTGGAVASRSSRARVIARSPNRPRTASIELRQAIRAVRRVEQGELLRVRQVDGGEPDEPDAAPRDERPAKQRQRRVVEDPGLPGLAGQRRLAGEGLEPLVPKLELDRSRRELVPAQAAGDRLGEVEQGRLEAADVGGVGVERVLVANALRAVGHLHAADGRSPRARADRSSPNRAESAVRACPAASRPAARSSRLRSRRARPGPAARRPRAGGSAAGRGTPPPRRAGRRPAHRAFAGRMRPLRRACSWPPRPRRRGPPRRARAA